MVLVGMVAAERALFKEASTDGFQTVAGCQTAGSALPDPLIF